MSLNETLKAISDPVRRQILESLKNQSQSAGEIAAQFDLSQATVSYHLKLLTQVGLITSRKEKNWIYYDLNISVFEEILTWIYNFSKGPESSNSEGGK
ncbi:autorepressor SdpR family transcription factor [Paucilactobacillus nenjiangensis]|uniref:Winged helix-turn-helix transcriptional regulator n=1 Tax=Paucilactobacillus nenjiangensis TaxID=1296540 RepID=A0A5P1WZE5_9LACO|nr:autorepressor SdpR family transcription factor [Paucilactobacillus nenjiangensis]QER67022.1 winged helix-turn-helix transcriptional regulator [Paucilactobacillus nenjiangensis]